MKRRLWLALAASAIATQARAQFGGRNRRPSPKKDETPQVNTIEVTLYELEEDLKLADSQRPLWKSYADKVRAMISDAAKTLYASLTPDQQRAADPRLANILSGPSTQGVPGRK